MPAFLKARHSRPLFVEDVFAPLEQTMEASFEDAASFTLFRGARDFLDLRGSNEEENRTVTPEQARERIGDLDLHVNENVSPEYLEGLIRRKKDELRRQQIIARSQPGIATGVANFSAALAASITDPGDLAVSMIPVVGQAKYATMLRSAKTPLARAGVRARVGATGGVVGTAATEPIVYGFAQYRQADYDMADSLTSIAFGGIMGGGLHTMGGAILDGIKRPPKDSPTANAVDNVSADTRQNALGLAMSQMNEGRAVDIEHVLDADPRYSFIKSAQTQDRVAPVRSGDSTSPPVREMIGKLRTTVEQKILDIESRYEGAIISRGDVKDLKDRRFRLSDGLSKVRGKMEGRSPQDPVYKGLEKRRIDIKRELDDVAAILKDQDSLRESRRKDISDLEKARKTIDNGLRDNMKDWPPFIRDAVDSQLKAQHKLKSSAKLQNAIDKARSQRRNPDLRNALTPERAEAVRQRVSSYDDETTFDEMLSTLESEIRRSDDPSVKKQMETLDSEYDEIETEIRKMESAMTELRGCKRANG